jgi:hypothetical protein
LPRLTGYALLLKMLRRLPLLIVAVAFLIAIEPVVHVHPHTAGNSVCAVCAAGVTQLPTIAPAVVAPAVVVSVLAPQPVSLSLACVALPRASRAPPAA